MRAFPPPRWGREGSSENQLRLWTSSRKRFFFFFFYYCFVIPPRESDLIDLKGDPMERSSVCPGVEGGVSVAWVAMSCLTPRDPRDCGPPDCPAHGIFQARILGWVAISFSRGSSWVRDWSCISCFGRWVLYHWATREARGKGIYLLRSFPDGGTGLYSHLGSQMNDTFCWIGVRYLQPPRTYFPLTDLPFLPSFSFSIHTFIQ